MRRVVAVLLCLAALTIAPAEAAPPIPAAPSAPLETALRAKEEVVYAHLSADGTVDRVFVVNAFRSPDGGILDYGDYVDVVNLSNSDEILQNGDAVEIGSASGDFYYQGESAGLEMPWLIGFDYVVDNRRVSADELRGTSGQLAIEVSVRRNPAADPVFFDNYMLQVSVNLDSQYFRAITSDGATIASNGTTQVVSLTSMPGKESDFVINAVAENAHVGQVQIAGLPFELMMELPDPAEYVGDLVLLQDAIALLADGVAQFTSGVGQLDDATGRLSAGASELAGGAHTISSGFDHLAAGRGEFDSGLRRYNDGVQEFATGMEELTSGLGAFTDGIDQLADGSSQLASGLDTYSAGVGQFSTGLNQASEGSQELTAGVQELSDGLQQLTEQGKYADPNLVGGSAQILEALQMLDAALSFPLSDEELDLLLDLLQTLAGSLDEVAQSVDETDLDAFLGLLRDALARFDGSVAEIEKVAQRLQDRDAVTADLGIDVTGNPEAEALLAYMADQGRQLDAASAELRAVRASLDGLDPLVEGLLTALEQLRDEFDTVRTLISRINDAVQGISVDDIRQLSDGLTLLSSNYATFHEGLVAYVDGVEQAYLGVSGDPGLLSGSRELSGGLETLAASGGDLADGAVALADGAHELDDGVSALRDGASQFSGQGGAIVDGVAQLADGGDALVSGHGLLLDGDAELGSGLRRYASGTDDFADGLRQYSGGLESLAEGGDELRAGAGTLRDETGDMDQQMTDRIHEAMSGFVPGEYTLVSAVDERNTGIERVQFVYLIDAQVEPAPEPGEVEDDSDKTIWDRFLDIFR